MKLVYISSVPWGSYKQRAHFMVRYLLEQKLSEVLWIDPYPGRLPGLTDFVRPQGGGADVTKVAEFVRVLQVSALPVEPIWGGTMVNRWLCWSSVFKAVSNFVDGAPWLLGVGRPNGLALQLLLELRPDRSFFDAMDDFPEFYKGISRRSVWTREQKIAALVDEVFTSSHALEQKFGWLSSKTTRVLNACDLAVLPPILPRNSMPKVLGYVGSIGDWFDWNLLCRLAVSFPMMSVRLIGPVFTRPPFALPENVELAGVCPHDRVGQHLAEFTVGLIPFRVNSLTRGVDPIKFYEYRAMGLPVLSTRFGQMVRRGHRDGVFFLDGPGGMEESLNQAVNFRESVESVQNFRENNSWSNRFAESRILEEMISVGFATS